LAIYVTHLSLLETASRKLSCKLSRLTSHLKKLISSPNPFVAIRAARQLPGRKTMTVNWPDKRHEFRFQLLGNFEGYNFAIGAHKVTVDPIDISRGGLGVFVDTPLNQDEEVEVKIHFPDSRPPVMLHVRFCTSEHDVATMKTRTRCGLELSDKDKRRGIDLIALLSGTPNLRLSCAS